jgi:glycosyltransferase involved in cell wall biosynthesis
MSKIEFIIPTYNRPNQLMGVISSIFSQRSDKWKIHVVADGPYDGYQKVKDYFVGDDRIKFSELETPGRDWGHTPRNYGLEHATEDWVVMSGDDNYYMPVFVDHFLNVASKNGVHFVYCDMIHNWVNFEYHHIKSQPKYGSIDIGNFMSKRTNAQRLRLDVTKEAADAVFVEEYMRKFNREGVKYIPKPLYVHN